MKEQTRKRFADLQARFAHSYGVASVERQFSITPSIAQTLKDKIVEASTFLPKINILPVDELKGENILGYAVSPVTGRTNTSEDGKERTPRNVMGLASYSYELLQTNADVALPYRLMDAWAYANGVSLDFSRPGKPTDNAYIEAFNGRSARSA